MNKDGQVAHFKHHDMAETKDVKETNNNRPHQHKKGGHHEGHGESPTHASLKDIHITGSDHHKGNQSGTPSPAFPVLQGDIPGAQ